MVPCLKEEKAEKQCIEAFVMVMEVYYQTTVNVVV